VRLRSGAELSGEVAEWCGVVWLGCGLVRSCLVRLRTSAELSIGYILLLYHKLKPIC